MPLPDPEPLSLDDEPPNRRTALYAGAGAAGLAGIGLLAWLASGKTPSKEKVADKKPTGGGAEQPLTGEQVFRRVIRNSTYIGTRSGKGSGVVVHAEKRFVVTNYHVVLREPVVGVLFPLYDSNGELITDARKYKSRAEEVTVEGEVVARHEKHDLALIRLERLPERTAAITIASQPAAPGSVVYSIGSSGANKEDNLLWRLTKGTVRGRVQKRFTDAIGGLDAMILETDAPVNPGDSGGPVVNENGELVALVSYFATRQRAVSCNIDAQEIREFLLPHLTVR